MIIYKIENQIVHSCWIQEKSFDKEWVYLRIVSILYSHFMYNLCQYVFLINCSELVPTIVDVLQTVFIIINFNH